MNFENTRVFNFDGALRGMRMPMQSFDRSDSVWDYDSLLDKKNDNKVETFYKIGPNDLSLARKLIKGGSEHRKFLRQIFISTDISMPMYVASEFDTYKLATVRNSSSFMHKGVSKQFSKEDFQEMNNNVIDAVINELNRLRDKYLETKDYQYFVEIRKLLPSSYIYKFTWTANYEVVWSMYNQRCVHPHRLKEWNTDFKEWAESLPYFKEFFLDNKEVV